MRKIITFAVDITNGLVFSRIGSEVAVPVLQYNDMLPENNFTPTYKLEKMPVFNLVSCWNNLKWTRKIPIGIKNRHRRFWGMKELKK